MGAYLQKPITDKVTGEDENEFLKSANASMQGWRINQEDAHNCLLNFDENTAFFAVYDGHGGSEVAEYCSLRLPAYLKETEAYKSGNIEQALKDTFIGFDQTLLEANVIEELKRLAKSHEYENEENEGESEGEEDIRGLYQEATMPLTEVLEKYKDTKANPRIEGLKAGSSSKPLSPCLKGKKTSKLSDEGAGSSSGSCDTGAPSGSSKQTVADDTVSSSSSKPSAKETTESSEPSSTSSGLGSSIADVNSTEKSSELDSTTPEKEAKTEKTEGESSTSSSTNNVNEANTKQLVNGEISASDSASKSNEDQISSSSVLENGEVSSNSKSGSASGVAAGSSSSTADAPGSSSSTSSGALGMRAAKINSIITSSSRNMAMDADDDSSDEDDDLDATYKDNDKEMNDLDEGETTDEVDESDDEDPGDDFEDGEEEEDESDDEGLTVEDEEFMNNMADEPGKDSGCTAVAAVLRGKQLWVANAGDSRCIVSRDGKVVEMSFDHKPEDEIEFKRIQNAGGRVSADGRVNGGLNLSRAIGDHGYKMNAELPPEEQMISALPDIKQLTLEENDEFMVLACDGIWNFMSNEEVVEFVKERIDAGEKTLIKICEELFDNCLAPNTMGDGTGCDNMTAIIVQFKPLLIASLSKTESKAEAETQSQTMEVNTTNGGSNKRHISDEVDDGQSAEAEPTECVANKRQKIEDDTETPAVDTSSA